MPSPHLEKPVPGQRLALSLTDKAGTVQKNVLVENAVIAGWTGRDGAAVEKHIRELEALGVRPPSTTPVYYRVAAARLTLNETIEVLGDHSSGEVEFVLLQSDGRLWLGTGSDHTDREVEAYDVAVSKQLCDKPLAAQFWAFDDVVAHWDRLILRSYIGARRALYQEGNVSAMLEPRELISRLNASQQLPDGTLMFCGTLPAQGGVRPSELFAFELEDPVLDRSIRHSYRIVSLPLVR
jgi:hypothetical protein